MTVFLILLSKTYVFRYILMEQIWTHKLAYVDQVTTVLMCPTWTCIRHSVSLMVVEVPEWGQ